MFTKTRMVWIVVILALVLSNTATYYAAPYIKIVHHEYSTVFVNQEEEVSPLQMDKKVSIVVIIEDALVMANENEHRRWAVKAISEKKEGQWLYWERHSYLGHTGVVFKPLVASSTPSQ